MFADVKQYANLIQTISFLLKCYKPRDRSAVSLTGNDTNDGILLETLLNFNLHAFSNLKFASSLNLVLAGDVVLPWPAFLMSWRRRIGKEDESLFFDGCEKAGLEVKHLGSRVYCIKPVGNENSETKS